MNRDPQKPGTAREPARVSRRDFLKVGGGAGAALAVTGAGLSAASPDSTPAADPALAGPGRRQALAFQIRRDAARAYLRDWVTPESTNGDEARYADKRASFSKTLPHNELGEVDPRAYAILVSTLAGGDPQRFEQLPAAPGAETKLNNPQATYAFDLVGLDAHATPLPPPPAFAGAETATEVAELYWLASRLLSWILLSLLAMVVTASGLRRAWARIAPRRAAVPCVGPAQLSGRPALVPAAHP